MCTFPSSWYKGTLCNMPAKDLSKAGLAIISSQWGEHGSRMKEGGLHIHTPENSMSVRKTGKSKESL